MADERIPLSDMIAQLRNELATAREEGQDKELQLLVEEAEIELQVALTREDSLGGSIKFWVCNAEAKDKFADATTQKIKLKVTPVDAKGEKFKMKATKKKAHKM